MQNVEITNLLVNFIKELATDPSKAMQFVSNPNGELVAQGITEHDLSGLDMPAIVQQACGEPGFPAEARGALQSYTSGGGGGGGQYSPPAHQVTSGPQSMEQVVQHLTYVTQVTNDNDVINEIVDQSTNIEVGDDFDGDIDVDTNNAFADGDGAVAVGQADGDVNAATGDNSQVVDGDIEGDNLVNSDGAVQIDGDNEAPVVTGENSGIIADGDVDDAIVGNNNQQQANDVDVDGDNEGVINFGDGDATSVNDSTLDNSNVGSGTNIADNDDSAIGLGDGDTSNVHEDNDTTTQETTTIDADDSVVNTEQGDGDQHADFDQDNDFSLPQPVRALDEPEEHVLHAEDHDDADAPV